jgi:CheY-like chemotaxis protein
LLKVLQDGPQPLLFDIVFMDLQMLEMNGHTATRLLRADRRFDDLPIVAMTAHALVEERQRCLKVGMNDHASKPLDPDALFAALVRWTKPHEAIEAEAKLQSPTGTEKAELPVIEGVDTAAGLSRVAGNKRSTAICSNNSATNKLTLPRKLPSRSNLVTRPAHSEWRTLLKVLPATSALMCAGSSGSGARDSGERYVDPFAAHQPGLRSGFSGACDSGRSNLRNRSGPLRENQCNRCRASAMARLKVLLETNDGDAADEVENVAGAVRWRVDEQCISALRSFRFRSRESRGGTQRDGKHPRCPPD